MATLRATLADEAAALQKQIEEIEHASHVLRAALDVQNVWNLRADILRQLDLLKDVRQLPEKAVEKLDACLKRIQQCRERMKKLVGRRNRYKKDLDSLQVNRVLLSHASRIEALHDQSQWVGNLEEQIGKLREEVKRLDDEIDAAVHGYSKSAGIGSIDELPNDTVNVLRRPAQVLKEENDKLEKIKAETDAAKRELDAAIEQYQTVGLTRNVPDLNQAIQEAGHRVSLLRRRIQVEERVDQLSRRREELEFDSDELHSYEHAPMRITALMGLVFSVGIALILFGIFGGLNNWIDSGVPWAMFGLVMSGLAIGGRLLTDRHSEDSLTDNHRHLEQHRSQLTEAKRERDEIDAELPTGSGSLDARMREAEMELRDLERLIPIRTEREQALARHQAAQRRLGSAQEAMKEAKHRWKNALKSVGLPEDFAPLKVKQVVTQQRRRARAAPPPRRPQGRARSEAARDDAARQPHPADRGRRAAHAGNRQAAGQDSRAGAGPDARERNAGAANRRREEAPPALEGAGPDHRLPPQGRAAAGRRCSRWPGPTTTKASARPPPMPSGPPNSAGSRASRPPASSSSSPASSPRSRSAPSSAAKAATSARGGTSGRRPWPTSARSWPRFTSAAAPARTKCRPWPATRASR